MYLNQVLKFDLKCKWVLIKSDYNNKFCFAFVLGIVVGFPFSELSPDANPNPQIILTHNYRFLLKDENFVKIANETVGTWDVLNTCSKKLKFKKLVLLAYRWINAFIV